MAKLARLGLTEDEVETMAGELSGILEHVDRIGELDLDDVAPTSHVVELENVLRADVPQREPGPRGGAGAAPDPGGWGVSSSLAAGGGLMAAEMLELTVAAGDEAKIAAGELSAVEYSAAWGEAAAGDELNAYLWRDRWRRRRDRG